jgi:hypothetical protein
MPLSLSRRRPKIEADGSSSLLPKDHTVSPILHIALIQCAITSALYAMGEASVPAHLRSAAWTTCEAVR